MEAKESGPTAAKYCTLRANWTGALWAWASLFLCSVVIRVGILQVLQARQSYAWTSHGMASNVADLQPSMNFAFRR
jgi:hypothetical protein